MKKYLSKILKFFLLFVIGFFGGVVGVIVTPFLQQSTTSPSSSNSTAVSKTTYNNQNDTTKAVEKIQDAVVSVINYQTSTGESILGNSDEDSDGMAVAGEGSGVIYKKNDKDAYLVTNTHVVAGAEKIDIQLSSGEKVEGELIGSDTYSDIAVIRISSDQITTTAKFADSDSINVGETAIAIGSPLGTDYANSVTKGIVSSLSRTVTSQSEDGQTISTNAIQTDTAINPGNSGGPLINIQGQVIGITSSKITTTSSSIAIEGMGFAIPSNDVVNIIEQLEESGKVIRPALGVQMVDVAKLSTSQLKEVGLDDSDLTGGVLVVSTQSGLPADGKLEKYDVITAIDDKKIESISDLQSALYSHTIDDNIEVTYYRDGKEGTTTIKLTHSTEDLS